MTTGRTRRFNFLHYSTVSSVKLPQTARKYREQAVYELVLMAQTQKPLTSHGHQSSRGLLLYCRVHIAQGLGDVQRDPSHGQALKDSILGSPPLGLYGGGTLWKLHYRAVTVAQTI
jgi:hypothetical protein